MRISLQIGISALTKNKGEPKNTFARNYVLFCNHPTFFDDLSILSHENKLFLLELKKSLLIMRNKASLNGNIYSAAVQWLSLLHNFIQESLNSGYRQVQVLLAACRKFEMVRISDNGPGSK